MSSEPGAPAGKAIVLDANILVRAVLGRRVLGLLEAYARRVSFVAPEIAFVDLQTYLPAILLRRGLPAEAVERVLQGQILGRLPLLVASVPREVFASLETDARRRLAGRDEADWPFVALALELKCPIWTEDQDFFGCGVPTWTTDRVQIYFEADSGE